MNPLKHTIGVILDDVVGFGWVVTGGGLKRFGFDLVDGIGGFGMEGGIRFCDCSSGGGVSRGASGFCFLTALSFAELLLIAEFWSNFSTICS